MSILQAEHVTKRFESIVALDDLSMNIEKGTIVGLIGPNGSGKTTFLNLVTGFATPDRGQVFFKGERIEGRRPHEFLGLGIGRTFQETRVFKKMSVMENLLVASPYAEGEKSLDKARSLLEFVRLSAAANRYASQLSYGQQKLLELARLMMQDLEMILLDEPTAGVSQALIEELLTLLAALQKQGKTILLVEHNIHAINTVCNRVVVLDHGRKIAEGTPMEVQQDKTVQEAYLGSERHATRS